MYRGQRLNLNAPKVFKEDVEVVLEGRCILMVGVLLECIQET